MAPGAKPEPRVVAVDEQTRHRLTEHRQPQRVRVLSDDVLTADPARATSLSRSLRLIMANVTMIERLTEDGQWPAALLAFRAALRGALDSYLPWFTEGDGVRRPSARSPSLPKGSRWRLLDLENTTDDIQLRRIVLFERIDGDSPLRIWCQDLVDEEPWTRVRAELDGDQMRVDLPSSEYYGMPLRMFVARPKNPAVGSRWLLRGEDGETVLAPLLLKRILTQSDEDITRIENFYRRPAKRK